MNDALRIQISAFVDGELQDNESELLLRRFSQDAELRQLVAHYIDIGRQLRRDPDVPNMKQLRTRIAAALGEDTHVAVAPPAPAARQLVKPLAGIAVAASVAMLAIFALQQTGGPESSDADMLAVTDSYTEPAAEQMLDEMFRHHEIASDGAGSSAILDALANREFSRARGYVLLDPKAELVSPIEIPSENNEEESDDASEEQQVD